MSEKHFVVERTGHHRTAATALRTTRRRARPAGTVLRKGTRLRYLTNLSAAHALFASGLQPSQRPTPTQVRHAIAVTLARFGAPGCVNVMAEEFGARPETAAPRMAWALSTARALHPG